MRDKILIAVIFMMCCLLLIPPVFAEGGWFDVTYYYEHPDGSLELFHGLYADNVFNTIFMLSSSYLGLIIPYLKPNLNRNWKRISCFCGAWFLAGLFYELMNFTLPEIVFNSMDDNWLYFKYAIIFTLGIASIITHETWSKQMKS